MDEFRRYEVYTRQKGDQWTPTQITRHRKKINQERKRYNESRGSVIHLRKLSNGQKSGYTNEHLKNPS